MGYFLVRFDPPDFWEQLRGVPGEKVCVWGGRSGNCLRAGVTPRPALPERPSLFFRLLAGQGLAELPGEQSATLPECLRVLVSLGFLAGGCDESPDQRSGGRWAPPLAREEAHRGGPSPRGGLAGRLLPGGRACRLGSSARHSHRPDVRWKGSSGERFVLSRWHLLGESSPGVRGRCPRGLSPGRATSPGPRRAQAILS